MTKASDNAFPSILITEGTEPSAPAAGKQRLYIDSTSHKLKRTDSSGVDVTIESGSMTVVHKTGDEAKSSMSFADSTGMGFSVAANTNYLFRYVVFFNTNATSVGIRLAVNGPASPTLLKVGGYSSTGAGGTNDTTIALSSATAYDTAIFTATTGPGATNTTAVIEGLFKNGSNAGTLILRHASETATATTIEAGSYGTIESF